MSGPQLFAVWALLGLAVLGIPGYWLGWAVGRACLRADLAALDPRRLPPVDDPGVRVVVDDALPVAGRFPVDDDALTWSELQIAGDRAAAAVEASTAETVADIRRYTVAAELADAERQDDEDTMRVPAATEAEIRHMADVAEALLPPRHRMYG